MGPDPNEPALEWPLARGEQGREVWYSLVSPRDGSTAFWYRYTLLSTSDGHQEGRVWAAFTDRDNPSASTFISAAAGLDEVEISSTPFEVTITDSTLTSSSATGRVDDISWTVEYQPDIYTFTPLRSETLTNVLSRTLGTGKHWSRNESVFMNGEVTIGDRSIDLTDAPGHQGHTVSYASPPDEWTWVQCNDFDEAKTAVLEALRLDNTLSICFRVNGDVYPLNRLKHVIPYSPSANQIDYDEPGHWRFHGAGDGIELEVTVEADSDHWQTVTYMTPDDTIRYNAHCSLSDIIVTYSIDDGESRTIRSDAARAEWVSTDPPVEGDYAPEWH